MEGKKLDVKTATFNSTYRFWKFLLYRQKSKIDFFLILCKDKEKKTQYIFLIPDKDIKRNNLIISLKNIKKYYKYLLKVR